MARRPTRQVLKVDRRGRYGDYGGRFVPETLIPALDELTDAFATWRRDADFRQELREALQDYAGRPTPLTRAPRFSERAGLDVWLKREDLLHTGAHKLNNTLAIISEGKF